MPEPVGYVDFDDLGMKDGELLVRIPAKEMNIVRRGQYVRVEQKPNTNAESNTRNYLARFIWGPLFVPDAVDKNSAFARAAILNAGTMNFRPDYHAVCGAEVIAEIDENLNRIGTFGRPQPQSAVYLLDASSIQKLLDIEEGGMYLGTVTGYPDVKMFFPPNRNAGLPRNVGIFGTVGSGKTNTSQVLIEEAVKSGWSVIVLDVEGEYVDMDKKSEQTVSHGSVFDRFGIEPEGVAHLSVYHTIGNERSRSDSKPFSVGFTDIEPFILGEILDLSDPQMDRFLEMTASIEEQKESKTGDKARAKVAAIDFVTGDEDTGPAVGVQLAEVMQRIRDKLSEKKIEGQKSTYYALIRKLNRLKGYGIFDKGDYLNFREMLQPQKVSIIDLSGAFSPWVNNIVIMHLLRGIFRLKKGKEFEGSAHKILIVIEEAHTLVSRDTSGKMTETLNAIREITRRGRKRWVGLCFVTQQPSHLPSEIYELCNTKFIHQTTGQQNLNALKSSTGSVNESVWNQVPILGQGNCLLVSSFFKNQPIFCDIRICSSKRRHTED